MKVENCAKNIAGVMAAAEMCMIRELNDIQAYWETE